jgi:hypothetical protein
MPDTLISQERPAIRVSAVAVSGGANVTLISLSIARIDGRSGVHTCDLWLSDAASGAGLTAVTASGAVAAGASGLILQTITASKVFKILTTATGLFILSITDSAKTPFVVCVEIEGRAYPVITLTTANYG